MGIQINLCGTSLKHVSEVGLFVCVPIFWHVFNVAVLLVCLDWQSS